MAEELNLSIGTISKALTDSPEIPSTTRNRIVELAEKRGYRRQVLTQELGKKRRTKRAAGVVGAIALLLQTDATIDFDHTPHAAFVVRGLSKQAHLMGVSLLLHCVPLKDRARIWENEFQPVAMRRGLVSGLVLQNHYPADAFQKLVKQLPCVTICSHVAGLAADVVDVDSTHAMNLVVRRLFQLGHRRIGFLGWSTRFMWNTDRYYAYVRAMQELGLSVDPKISDLHSDATLDDPAMIARVISQTRSGVTAWVTPSDAVGFIWSRRFLEAGFQLGKQVSLTGIDGARPPSGCPSLTTIKVPFEEMGAGAVRLLVERIRQPGGTWQRVMYQGQLIPGDTAGTP